MDRYNHDLEFLLKLFIHLLGEDWLYKILFSVWGEMTGML